MAVDPFLPQLISLATLDPAARRPRAPVLAQAFATLAQRLDPDARPEGQAVVLQVKYVDALGIEPDEMGERYVYTLPPHAPRGGAWQPRRG